MLLFLLQLIKERKIVYPSIWSICLGAEPMLTLQVNLRLAPDKNSAASSSTPSHRKKVGVYGQKSATMDLQVMTNVIIRAVNCQKIYLNSPKIGMLVSKVNHIWAT